MPLACDISKFRVLVQKLNDEVVRVSLAMSWGHRFESPFDQSKKSFETEYDKPKIFSLGLPLSLLKYLVNCIYNELFFH